MDIPFSSSGAMSRAHYALVRKVEAATPQAADQILLAEVQSVRQQLARSTLTLRQCKEALILLLYCAMTINPGMHVDLEFALAHAVNLAETGQTVQDKRTGYMFCAEVMPPDHDLQLMLVNTIRKDLESPLVPRICLALETLIKAPSRDVIPAIQSRLHDMLWHNSGDVRRRALLAYRVLSEQDPDLLSSVLGKTRKRLTDPDPMVVSAAFRVADRLVKAQLLPEETLHTALSARLEYAWATRHEPGSTWMLVRTMEALASVIPSLSDVQILLKVVREYAPRGSSAYTIIRQCFRAVNLASSDHILEAQTAAKTTFIHEVRHLLTPEEPNALWLFMFCLSSVDPKLWAGTSPEVPAVLDGWEVERVMKLLGSEDKLLRKQTLRMLHAVDPGIVESYYSQALQGEFPTSTIHGSEETLTRLFEVLDITCGEDGEAYAHHLQTILKAVDGDGPSERRPILQEAVQETLVRMRQAGNDFRSGCIGALFTTVADADSHIGNTLLVILTALLCEYLELSSFAPTVLLAGLARRLSLYSQSIQDATLIAMVRISASCDEVSTDVTDAVKELHVNGGRYVKRRCDQFLSLSQSKETLRRILATADSSSLPDFVVALETYDSKKATATSHSPPPPHRSQPEKPTTPDPLSSRASPSPSRLRYAAYDPPKPTQPLRRMSSSSSHHSDEGVGRRSSFQDPLSRTFTPGDLALAAGSPELRAVAGGTPAIAMSPLPTVQILDEENPVDLITLESPFMNEPTTSLSSTASSVIEPDFEKTWNELEGYNSRGWCEASIDGIVRQVQRLWSRLQVIEPDRPPFIGELKILFATDMASVQGVAALRLKESEDESCLWRLRCADEKLRESIKAVLQ